MSQCCLSGFQWNGTPTGQESKLANNKAYITGSNKDVAILLVHDVFGWTFNNSRLLADHFAKEANATVFLPDYFEGEVVTPEMLLDPKRQGEFNMQEFFGVKNTKERRFPEMAACAKALKHDHGFKKVGAIGYCFGGWGVFQLGGKGQNLVDCISTAHPSRLTKEEIDNVAVPVQILDAEHDPMFNPEVKQHANLTIPTLGVEYDYQFFPGSHHGFAVRCDESNEGEKKALERAKNAAVAFFTQFLHLH